jgi:hypothetical protein
VTAAPRPDWATETVEPTPETYGMYSATIAVGDISIRVDQVIDADGDGTPEPVLARLDIDVDCDAQACRDLATALLEAARIIDSA